jgi:hypothetical protein
MHERLLAEAAWPAPAICLGLLLRPYSLGHELRLIRLNNPLAARDEASARQLAEAALICHQSWKECERMPWDPLIRFKLWLWKRRAKGFRLKTEVATFVEYREKGSREFPPSGIANPSSPKRAQLAGAPFLLRLQHFLVMKWGLTDTQAWDYPYGFAKMHWQTVCEENGTFSIYNMEEALLDTAVAESKVQKETPQ